MPNKTMDPVVLLHESQDMSIAQPCFANRIIR